MTVAERKLAAYLLGMAGEHYGNHGCNDFDLVAACDDDAEAARRIAIGFHAHNLNKPESELVIGNKSGDVWETDLLNIGDYGLMQYMAHRLEATTNENP